MFDTPTSLTADRWIDEVAGIGARLIVLPEAFLRDNHRAPTSGRHSARLTMLKRRNMPKFSIPAADRPRLHNIQSTVRRGSHASEADQQL